MGQLIQKGIGGKSSVSSRLQTVDYTYNIRGWLKGINDTGVNNAAITMGAGDLFGFKIHYNNPVAGTPLHNGNISQTFWKTTNPIDTSLRNYTYSYDALNRLTSAVDNLARYNESLSYDKNGNILSLIRKGNTDANATSFGTMDNLIYTYLGNRLNTVEDSSGSNEGFKDGSHATQEYSYDDNGNMKADSNKGITAIVYNYLNLPTDITLAGGVIHYDYDAAGVKQRKVTGTITTDYAMGFQYEKVGSGTQQLKFFPTPEGYAENNSGTFNYIYQYKDHLGNIRLSYKDVGTTSPSLQIVEENNYYPFGMKQKVAGEVVNQAGYQYKFNGMEESKDFGINWLHPTKFRTYDPAIGKFNGIDPLADKSNNITPYAFVMNNPILYSDLTGADTTKLREIIVYAKKQVNNSFNWFTGANVGYTGSGWGHGLRRSLANQIGIGNRANNIFELGLQSQLQAKQVNLSGSLLDKIKEDEGMLKFQNDIIKTLKNDPRFKKLQFITKGKGGVEFGGKRWSSSSEDWGALNNNNPVFHGETWAVGGNQLTWVTRHASMEYTATVKSDGTIVIDFQLSDTFDLSGQKGRSEAYNNISNTAGFLYHDVVGGNSEMKINANWQVENKN